jgi:Rps23 Pro-64 3,4-dihydroxylase Tpa1-like proline 4-hydroxylase
MEANKFSIYDDVMNDEEFKKVWDYVQNEEYVYSHVNNWIKVWRLTDGRPVGSKSYKLSDSPFRNGLDLVIEKVLEGAKKNDHLLGDWDEIHFRSYLYSRGTKISWHNDFAYTGACIFYTHPKWASSWGGELMVAETPENVPDPPNASSHLDHRWEDAVMEAYGMGNYITPKPNRMVFTAGNVWHSVNRVDEDAGDHTRCSIVCFFQKSEESGDVVSQIKPEDAIFPVMNPIPIVEM